MGFFKKWLRSEARPTQDLHAESADSAEPECTSVEACTVRQHARISGTVSSVLPSTDPPHLTATVKDGSGEITATWLGRTEVPGIRSGVSVLLEGTVGRDHAGQKRILDPKYTILAE